MLLKYFYNIGIYLFGFALRVLSKFNKKIRLGTAGRQHTFHRLQRGITKKDQTIWMHCASLGEYEQGLPVIKALRAKHPNHKFIVSFFSPSGYEIKKNSKDFDLAVYLPLDTMANANKFLDLVHPQLIIFVKYEIWPNVLIEANERQIASYLISATFRKNQSYFSWYGHFMRKAIFTFNHVFTQDKRSKKLLQTINYKNVTVSGDTRFDRVNTQLSIDNSVDFIENFTNNNLTVVFGSSWPADDALCIPFINSFKGDVKFIIAPHNVNKAYIDTIKSQFQKPTICYSEMSNKILKNYDIFILDTIGYLGKVYSYADIAYVGGAAGRTGLHNILEPAVFGIPIIIGENYQKFPEAGELIDKGGVVSVTSVKDLTQILKNFIKDEELRRRVGRINSIFIKTNIGAVNHVINKIDDLGLS